MICPECQGSGVVVLDVSGHNVDFCKFCDGYGHIALTQDGKTEDRNAKPLPQVRPNT